MREFQVCVAEVLEGSWEWSVYEIHSNRHIVGSWRREATEADARRVAEKVRKALEDIEQEASE